MKQEKGYGRKRAGEAETYFVPECPSADAGFDGGGDRSAPEVESLSAGLAGLRPVMDPQDVPYAGIERQAAAHLADDLRTLVRMQGDAESTDASDISGVSGVPDPSGAGPADHLPGEESGYDREEGAESLYGPGDTVPIRDRILSRTAYLILLYSHAATLDRRHTARYLRQQELLEKISDLVRK